MIQFSLNFIQQSSLVKQSLFWPRFYRSILRPKENCWKILRNHVPPTGPKVNRIGNNISCLNQNKCCCSYYQVQGDHAHLHQKMNKDLDEAVATTPVIHYCDDSLHLAVTYLFFVEVLPDPPDGLTKSTLYLALILFLYL